LLQIHGLAFKKVSIVFINTINPIQIGSTMKWSEAKRELRSKDKTDLVRFLKQLFELNGENKAFFVTNLDASKNSGTDYYKREISQSLNPDFDQLLDLKRGRKAISSFRKATPDWRVEKS